MTFVTQQKNTYTMKKKT